MILIPSLDELILWTTQHVETPTAWFLPTLHVYPFFSPTTHFVNFIKYYKLLY